MNGKNCQLVAFDLDGTLVDSAPDLALSGNQMLDALGHEPASLEQVRNWVGNGAAKLVQRLLCREMEPDAPHPHFDRALPLFLDCYANNMSRASRLYEGVVDGLEQLCEMGVSLACVTNKPIRFTEPLLDKLEIGHFFSKVAGGDSYPELKPHPMPLLETARHFGVNAGNALMVGDSNNDILAARAAGFSIYCVNYGYTQGGRIEDFSPDRVVNSVTEIPPIISSATTV